MPTSGDQANPLRRPQTDLLSWLPPRPRNGGSLPPPESPPTPASAPEISPDTSPKPGIGRHNTDTTMIGRCVRPYLPQQPLVPNESVDNQPETPGAEGEGAPSDEHPAARQSIIKRPPQPTPSNRGNQWQSVPDKDMAAYESQPAAPISFRQWFQSEFPAYVDVVDQFSTTIKSGPRWEGFLRQCIQPLNDDDIDAIILYTSTTMYLTLNHHMRIGSEELRAAYRPWTDQLQAAIAKLPRFTGTVYRVLNNNEVTMDYFRGREVMWPAFTSCSTLLSEQNVTSFGAQEGAASSTRHPCRRCR